MKIVEENKEEFKEYLKTEKNIDLNNLEDSLWNKSLSLDNSGARANFNIFIYKL